jgi:Bacterial PH domain
VIRGEGLAIRFGMVRMRIPWDRVIGIEPSSNPVSGPAMSLKRLDVHYKKGNGTETHVLISPSDRAAFVRDCGETSPRHRVDGERLISKTA